MIIKCQEHYDKVVEYAKSIGDNTLQQCIERLQGVVGGVLYHGRPDESYAVMLNPFHGWSIHT